MSFVIWKVLPDNPETARFLTNKEKEFIINRLALETGSGHGRVTNVDRIRLHHVIDAFKDWRIWCGVVCFWACSIGTYGYASLETSHPTTSLTLCEALPRLFPPSSSSSGTRAR